MQALEDHDPQQIGDYRLLGRLGTGGMGLVYLGQSLSNRLVAVKVIHRELAADTEFRDRFARETAAVRQVSGAFTAPVVDADPQATTPWLATMYIPAPTLDQAVEEQGPLPEHSVRSLGAGLCEALRDIHRTGLIHRDLKPGNVLLAKDGPRVLDFGIAHLADGTKITNTGMAIGTPGFWSPEQAENRKLTPASDVFALGALLGFAAQARLVFGSGHPLAQMRRVCDGEPDLADVPDGLRELLNRCLAKDPDQRPELTELLRMASGQPAQRVWLPTGVTAMIAEKTHHAHATETSGPADANDATEVTPLAAPTRQYTKAAAPPPPRQPAAPPSPQKAAPVGPPRSGPSADDDLTFARGMDMEESGETSDALRAYEEAAQAGHAGAMYRLGVVHEGLDDNHSAEYWYRRAADAGDTDAMNELGDRAHAHDRTRDAESWYRRAEAAGDPDGTANLGHVREESGDHATGERLFRRAAENGSLSGMFFLALRADTAGRSDEAEEWYRRAADAGDVTSMSNLGVLFELREEYDEAERWYRRAADEDDLDAVSHLSRLLRREGRATDAEEYASWAADTGSPRAMGDYADILHALGRTQSAEDWYRRAVEAGSTVDALGYGNLLQNEERYSEAEHYLRVAVENGHTQALDNHGNALHSLGRVREAEEQLHRAIQHGHTIAYYNLGNLCESLGRTAEAREWFRMSLDLGDSDAEERIHALDESARPAIPRPQDSAPSEPPATFGEALAGIMIVALVPIAQIPIGWIGSGLWDWISGAVGFLPTWNYDGFFSGPGFLQALGLGYFLVNVVVMGAISVRGLFERGKDIAEWSALATTMIIGVVTFLILRAVGWI